MTFHQLVITFFLLQNGASDVCQSPVIGRYVMATISILGDSGFQKQCHPTLPQVNPFFYINGIKNMNLVLARFL